MTEQPGGSTPSQYGLPEGATDLQDLIEYREMNFALGNIFKACYRRGTCSHSDELRDMRKIAWFAQREIDRLEREYRVAHEYLEASSELARKATPPTEPEVERTMEGMAQFTTEPNDHSDVKQVQESYQGRMYPQPEENPYA